VYFGEEMNLELYSGHFTTDVGDLQTSKCDTPQKD